MATWRKTLRQPGALSGGMVLAVLAVLAVVVPPLSPYPYSEIDLQTIKQPPSLAHWMGTDELGRDLGTRLMIGGRISLAIGLAGALVASFVGAGIGALAGYYGGWVDAVTMSAVDLLLAIPILPVLIVISAFTFRRFRASGGKDRRHGVGAQLPRPRRPATSAKLGQLAVRSTKLSRHRALVGDVSGRFHFPCGAGSELTRGRPAGSPVTRRGQRHPGLDNGTLGVGAVGFLLYLRPDSFDMVVEPG